MEHGRSGPRGLCAAKHVVIKKKREQEFVRIREMADHTVQVMILRSCHVTTTIISLVQVNC